MTTWEDDGGYVPDDGYKDGVRHAIRVVRRFRDYVGWKPSEICDMIVQELLLEIK